MPVELELRITPESVDSIDAIHKAIIQQSNITAESIQHVEILRKSLDARKHPIVFLLKVRVFQATETVTVDDKTFTIHNPIALKHAISLALALRVFLQHCNVWNKA
jgi:hypothetical protein